MRHLLAVCTAIAVSGLGSPLDAQLADYYRGTVVNDGLQNQPATLDFSVFARSDSQTAGCLQVGPPLGGTGIAAAVDRGVDSLYLISTSATGDTIVWGSATRTGTIGGRYWIRGGPDTGQRGTWQLEPRQRTPIVTLVLVALFIAVAVLLLIYALAVSYSGRWWSWQQARPMSGATDLQLREWRSGVGGWLALLVVASCIVIVLQLVRANEIREALGPSWMFGAAVPNMRPALLIESAAQTFQLLAVTLGLVLIVRRSSLAPPYWVALLLTLACYAVYDVIATGDMLASVNRIFGPRIASRLTSVAEPAKTRNTWVVLSATIWTLYWLLSRRVRVRFSPTGIIPLSPSNIDVRPGDHSAVASSHADEHELPDLGDAGMAGADRKREDNTNPHPPLPVDVGDLDTLCKEYRDWSTEDLLRVVAASDSYRPEAVSVVREILAARNPAEVAALTEVVAADQQQQEVVANEPLSWGLKAFCLLFCGLPGIGFALIQESQGRRQRAREAWQWVSYGLISWFVLGLMCSL